MSEGQCAYPRCRQAPIISLGYADGIRLCEKHHVQYCDIGEDEDGETVKSIVRHEKTMLKFQAKCGSATARRHLSRMEKDLDSYQFQHVGTGRTVAEHQDRIDARKTEELLAADNVPDPDGDPELAIADELGDFDEDDPFGINS